jgi:hypothetical protein
MYFETKNSIRTDFIYCWLVKDLFYEYTYIVLSMNSCYPSTTIVPYKMDGFKST